MSVNLVRAMIPSVAVRDPRWRKFNKEQFTTGKFKAHTELYHTIGNKLLALQEQEK